MATFALFRAFHRVAGWNLIPRDPAMRMAQVHCKLQQVLQLFLLQALKNTLWQLTSMSCWYSNLKRRRMPYFYSRDSPILLPSEKIWNNLKDKSLS